jgi:hypothetical protein
VQIIANGADDDLPGVEANANLHGNPMGAKPLVGIRLHRGLHGQGRITGPQGMVFMDNRRTKQRHDAIP